MATPCSADFKHNNTDIESHAVQMDDNPENKADAESSVTALYNPRIASIAGLAKTTEHMPIRWAELPKVPFFGLILGFNDQWYRAAIGLNVIDLRRRAQRSLTPEETQIVSWQTAKSVATMSYEVPLLFGAVWIYERRGRAAFKFPFYQPGQSFNPDLFPSAKYAFLRGTAARYMWHFTRVAVYTSLTHWIMRSVFISYAMSVKAVEFEREPRLADLRMSIKQNMASQRAARNPRATTAPGPSPPQEQPNQEGGEGGWTESGEPQAQNLDYPGRLASGASQSIWQRQQQQRQQQQRQQQQQKADPPAQGQPGAESGDDAFGDADGFDDEGYHDDASPVAPTQRRKGWQQTANGAGGSAWDRVRTQAANGETPRSPAAQGGAASRRGSTPSQPQGNTSKPSEDYAFSSADEEASYARDQAQKQFDDMIERERQGDDIERKKRR